MKLLLGARDRRLQSTLVMISLCTLWVTHLVPFQKPMHLLMLTTGRKLSVARWIPSWLTEPGKSLNVLMGVNL